MRIAVLALLVAACGDDGAPAPGDAARDGTPDTATACTTPGECPCFSNDDCPTGTRCHAATPSSVYCEPGPRGTGAPGSTCTMEHDCDSALCVDAEPDTMRCSRTCDSPDDCPTELPRCLAAIGICARAV